MSSSGTTKPALGQVLAFSPRISLTVYAKLELAILSLEEHPQVQSSPLHPAARPKCTDCGRRHRNRVILSHQPSNAGTHPLRIWLVDLASSLPPTVKFDGFDISLAQAPVAKWLPSNIELHKWDMFSEPAAELIGQFDVVHVRLVTLVIKDNNVLPLVKNILKLLSRTFLSDGFPFKTCN